MHNFISINSKIQIKLKNSWKNTTIKSGPKRKGKPKYPDKHKKKKTEALIKNPPTKKSQCFHGFTDEFYQIIREQIILIYKQF